MQKKKKKEEVLPDIILFRPFESLTGNMLTNQKLNVNRLTMICLSVHQVLFFILSHFNKVANMRCLYCVCAKNIQ